MHGDNWRRENHDASSDAHICSVRSLWDVEEAFGGGTTQESAEYDLCYYYIIFEM
jgi:hypothetical protein